EVKVLFDKVRDMVTTGKSNDGVGKLAVFAGVHKFPARVKCAILPWHAVVAAVEGKQEPVSTETESA
ncbi:MAG: SUF system NifU family Fe-S cluster assembly protein, partial [Verrucomicrobiota bacterium]